MPLKGETQKLELLGEVGDLRTLKMRAKKSWGLGQDEWVELGMLVGLEKSVLWLQIFGVIILFRTEFEIS